MQSYKAQKDAILLAVEVSESMLTPPPASDSKKADRDTPVQAALKCAYHLMEQRIISNPKDMMGILLFGTENSKFHDDGSGRGGLGYPHCYLFTDLDVPAADDVRALKALVEEGEDEEDVLKPTSETVSMSNVLFCANQIFTTKAANFGSRRLFIVTDNDDPHASDKAARSAAAVRAKDLYDLGVTIDLFPITRGDKIFQVDKFYDVRPPCPRPYLVNPLTCLGYHLSRPGWWRGQYDRGSVVKIWGWPVPAGLAHFQYQF